MFDKKIINICRNIIAISLSLALLIYFAYANVRLADTNAAQLPSEESSLVPESEVEEENEQDTLQPSQDNLVGDTVGEDSPQITPDSEGDENNANNENSGENNQENMQDNTSGNSLEDAENPENNPENTVGDAQGDSNPQGEDEIRLAQITYTYTDMAEGSPSYGTEVTENCDYVGLAEAVTGAKEVNDIMIQRGYENYHAVVKLLDDIVLEQPLILTTEADYGIDFQGHTIALAEGTHLDFGSSNVEFYNTATDLTAGGIVGQGSYLVTGTGDFTIYNGYWNAVHGSIFANAKNIKAIDGYFLAGEGRIVENAEQFMVDGGYYVYEATLGFIGEGNRILADQMAFVQEVRILNDVEYAGYCLGQPTFVISYVGEEESDVDILPVQRYYYALFEEAFDAAADISASADGRQVTIEVCAPEVAGVAISKGYQLTLDEEEGAANICIRNMKLGRSNTYDGPMFTVVAGSLCFEDCLLNGALDESQVSQASLIRVWSSGTLELRGTKGMTIKNNTSLAAADGSDPGAGIYLKNGAKLKIAGAVNISGNNLYIPVEQLGDESLFPQNIYMQDDAQIEISGRLTGGAGSLGVTLEDGALPGISCMGYVEESYLAMGTEQEKAELLDAFVMDGLASYYLTLEEQGNRLIWDRTTKLLPEAGILRIEFLLLLLGLFGFIMRNIPGIKKNRWAEIYVSILAIICLGAGVLAGVSHIRQEQSISRSNLEAIAELEAEYQRQSASASTIRNNEQGEAATETIEQMVETIEETEATEQIFPEDGRSYYGIVEIPELGIKLAVLEQYSDADMKTSPCVYYGDVEDNNLVIVGHNYDSQFGKLNGIEETITVKVTLKNGDTYTYAMTDIEYLMPSQIDEMVSGNWDLTLFTCNYSGEKRLAVRCKLQ